MSVIFAFHGTGKTTLVNSIQSQKIIDADSFLTIPITGITAGPKTEGQALQALIPWFISNFQTWLIANPSIYILTLFDTLNLPYLLVLPQKESFESFLKNCLQNRKDSLLRLTHFAQKYDWLINYLNNSQNALKHSFFLKKDEFLLKKFTDIQNTFFSCNQDNLILKTLMSFLPLLDQKLGNNLSKSVQESDLKYMQNFIQLLTNQILDFHISPNNSYFQ